MTPMDLSTKCNPDPTLQPIFECDSTQLVEPSTLSANSGTGHEPILTENTTHSKSIEESTGGSNTGDRGKSEPTPLHSKNRQLSKENMCKMSLKVILNKYELNNERQIIHIPQTLMDSLPSSKYCKDWDVYILTDEGFESDTTVIYWPLTDESSSEHAKSDPPPLLLPLALLDADQPLL